MTNANARKKKNNLSKYVSDLWNRKVCHFRNEALYIDSFSQHLNHENKGLFRRSYEQPRKDVELFIVFGLINSPAFGQSAYTTTLPHSEEGQDQPGSTQQPNSI